MSKIHDEFQNELQAVEILWREKNLDDENLLKLIKCTDKNVNQYLMQKADEVRRSSFGNKIFARGLIEISNYCKNDCYYCGIAGSNKAVQRFRLNFEQIYNCAKQGYELGFRTFVLQGGEDVFFSDEILCKIIKDLKNHFPDTALTLSLGERSFQSYECLFKAGCDRYLLRHESANSEHYKKLHPQRMFLKNRIECLKNLKKIGFQTGCGFMVASPYQDFDCILQDLRFIQEFKPHMVGIGPFLPAYNTVFSNFGNDFMNCDVSSVTEVHRLDKLFLTLRILAIVRIMNPKVLLPATTALATVSTKGREMGLKCGCNVIMPNISPKECIEKYSIYDGKFLCISECVQEFENLKKQIISYGYEIVVDRGDFQE